MSIVRYAEAFATKVFGWIFVRGDTVAAAGSAASDTLMIVSAYAAALSLPRAQVTDSAELPYPKPRIKHALITAIGLATQETLREELRNAYLRLAEWQDRAAEPAPGVIWPEKIAAERLLLKDELRLVPVRSIEAGSIT